MNTRPLALLGRLLMATHRIPDCPNGALGLHNMPIGPSGRCGDCGLQVSTRLTRLGRRLRWGPPKPPPDGPLVYLRLDEGDDDTPPPPELLDQMAAVSRAGRDDRIIHWPTQAEALAEVERLARIRAARVCWSIPPSSRRPGDGKTDPAGGAR